MGREGTRRLRWFSRRYASSYPLVAASTMILDSRRLHAEERVPLRADRRLLRPRALHPRPLLRAGLPEVFDPSERPWVRPDRANPDRVAEVVMRCPSGALQFEREDGGATEPIPQENAIAVIVDGPLYVRGNVQIKDPL